MSNTVATTLPGMNLPQSAELHEVAKALGYGSVTTDVSLLTQGGAGTYESLDRVVAEMTFNDNSFSFFDSMRVSQAGQQLDQWIDTTDIGGKYGDTRAKDTGTTREGTSRFDRNVLRMKFFTSRGGISKVLLKSPNFLQELNQEDVKAIRRIKRDLSRLIWTGNESTVPEEFDGFKAILSDPARGNYDGEHVADLMGNGYSGLDANGFSNPADIETATNRLAANIARPQNGSGRLTDIYMSVNDRLDINAYKNFESRQIYSGGDNAQQFAVGSVLSGFTNPWAGASMMTRINHDQYIPDGTALKSAQARGEAANAVDAPPPGIPTTAISSAADSRFATVWAGTYRYWIAAVGINGESTLVTPAAGAIVAAGNVVTVTIPQSTGGSETAYNIYRGYKNGPNDPLTARLVTTVAKTGASTVFVDKNLELPGASTVYLLNKEDPEFMDWRQLFGFFRTELPLDPNAIFLVPFACAISGALRVKKPRHGALITGFISKANKWSPYNGEIV